MRRFLMLLGCVAAVLVVAVPAATANSKPTTGTALTLGMTTFPADTPFYVEHGFINDLRDHTTKHDLNAHSFFDLSINGVLQSSTIDVDVHDGLMSRLNLYKFPAGLPAGTYTFDNVWMLDGVVFASYTQTIVFS
jgi:hypothetical protein